MARRRTIKFVTDKGKVESFIARSRKRSESKKQGRTKWKRRNCTDGKQDTVMWNFIHWVASMKKEKEKKDYWEIVKRMVKFKPLNIKDKLELW
jgi:hypothetical protein